MTTSERGDRARRDTPHDDGVAIAGPHDRSTADATRVPLAGRVAVVTGSTRGLGLAMARVLGHGGAHVVVSSRSDSHVKTAVDSLRAEGISASGLTCDTTILAEVEALRDHALAHGTLGVWINNAGVSGVYGPTASTPVDDFINVVRTNIVGTFHGSRVALPVFLEQGFGDLVNLYGEGDNGPVAMQNAYASSKRWVRQFTETLRRETRASGVRVHGMNPGLVTTDLLRKITAQKGYERRLDALPVVIALWGRTPAEAARPILRLVTTNRFVYRGLRPPSLLTRAVRNIAAGRLRATNRIRLDVSTLDRRRNHTKRTNRSMLCDDERMDASDNTLPRYRLLTGVDDSTFCERVSEALDLGYELHGGPAITWNGTTGYVAQAVIWRKEGPTPPRG